MSIEEEIEKLKSDRIKKLADELGWKSDEFWDALRGINDRINDVEKAINNLRRNIDYEDTKKDLETSKK